MKALLFIALILSGTGFSQTNIIAAKSHASAGSIDQNNADNFGLPYDYSRVVKSVKYFKDDCILETAEVTRFEMQIETDTICNHPFLQEGQIDIRRIKAMYPNSVEFIGFDKLKQDEKTEKKRLRKEKRKDKKFSGLYILLIGGGLFLIYLFKPNLNKIRA